jgi:hypothetical protein
MTKVYLVKIPSQELEVIAEDESEAMYNAQEMVDIDSIELIESDE